VPPARLDLLRILAFCALGNIYLAATYYGICDRSHIPFSESLFKTLKYRPAYPLKPFDTLGAARNWVTELVRWYNHEHRHSAIRFVTPAQRHRNLDQDILDRRTALYETARQSNPLRWKAQTRNWQRIDVVHLNPDRTDKISVVPQPRNQEQKAA